MKFSLSNTKLLQLVTIVKQAVASRTTNPILKTILFEAREDGWLSLRATNNILDITAMIEANIEQPGKICVSDLVIELLPTFAEGIYKEGELTNPIKFEYGEKGLIITQGKRKHRPAFQKPDDFPKKLELNNYQQIENKAPLIEAFQRLSIAVGVTEDRRILQGFHINPHANLMITGDGIRVYMREDFSPPGNIANPPAKLVMSVLSNLVGMTDKDTLEVETGGLMAFRGTQYSNEKPYMKWEIIVNGLEGEFPEIPRNLILKARSQEKKLSIKTNRRDLEKILEVCNIYSKRAFDEGKITHTILTKNGSGIVFSMHVPDLVEMEEPLECEYEGQDFRFLFHPGLALEALGTMKSENIELRFYGELAPFLILDGSSFTYLQGAMKDKKGQPVEMPKTETPKELILN